MSAAQKPSVTSSLRFFMVMAATRVIGSTALVSISSSWATQSRMPDSSFSRRPASSSVMARRARRAMRWTVARSTDMETLACGLRLSSARIAPRDASGNVASGLERHANLGHQDDIVAHLGDEGVGGLIQHRESPVMARNDQLELEEALAGERRGPRAHGVAVADRHKADL